MNNLFADIPKNLPDELTEIIATSNHVRIERIVSLGHASPSDFWYDQDENEFVLVIAGEAQLRFENKKGLVGMEAGNYCIIPAHERHRVEWTSPDEDTIWLAVFY
ncbi:MAG: cupin domain-containing protein [Candidatus Latescibacteria bacterium]|nr:cupin domain-containing protein [Candidatus Latescibacterota bacterium]